MTEHEEFDVDLLRRIRAAVRVGEVVATLGQDRPNEICGIDKAGIEIATGRSESLTGGSTRVPAWMFNHVWNELCTHGRVQRDYVDRLTPGRKVKRSSAVFAILERIPEVSIAQRRPLTLTLARSDD